MTIRNGFGDLTPPIYDNMVSLINPETEVDLMRLK